MEFNKIKNDNTVIETATLSNHAVWEHHLVIKPLCNSNFDTQLTNIANAFNEFLCAQVISDPAAIFMRFFVSDYANQSDIVQKIKQHPCGKRKELAISVVQQPPLPNAKVALWAYIIDDKEQTTEVEATDNELCIKRNNYSHIWNTQLITSNGSTDSDKQTANIFQSFNHYLNNKGLTMRENCLRTWLFVKDVDFNYQGVVEARKSFFESVGMTNETNFITSTGIEGRFHKPNINVLMDAYSVGGISSGQVKFLTAPDNLNPTYEYGVTFERGTSVEYGDRKHIFISGTASINNKGEVVHPRDVEKQAQRAIENVEALLEDARAGLQDIAHLIVYLRDASDYHTINNFLEENYSELPKIIVLAPVCRPEWLVEMECIAVTKSENKQFAKF